MVMHGGISFRRFGSRQVKGSSRGSSQEEYREGEGRRHQAQAAQHDCGCDSVHTGNDLVEMFSSAAQSSWQTSYSIVSAVDQPRRSGSVRCPGRKYGTPVSGWQQQLVSRIGVPDHTCRVVPPDRELHRPVEVPGHREVPARQVPVVRPQASRVQVRSRDRPGRGAPPLVGPATIGAAAAVVGAAQLRVLHHRPGVSDSEGLGRVTPGCRSHRQRPDSDRPWSAALRGPRHRHGKPVSGW